MTPVLEALDLYEAAVDERRQLGALRELPNEAADWVFALGFVLDQFRRNLEDLGQRAAERSLHGSGTWTSPRARSPESQSPGRVPARHSSGNSGLS